MQNPVLDYRSQDNPDPVSYERFTYLVPTRRAGLRRTCKLTRTYTCPARKRPSSPPQRIPRATPRPRRPRRPPGPAPSADPFHVRTLATHSQPASTSRGRGHVFQRAGVRGEIGTAVPLRQPAGNSSRVGPQLSAGATRSLLNLHGGSEWVSGAERGGV